MTWDSQPLTEAESCPFVRIVPAVERQPSDHSWDKPLSMLQLAGMQCVSDATSQIP